MEINKEELLGSYFQEAIEKIEGIVSIPSYRKNPEKGSPVDKDVVAALNYAIDLCKSFGWNTFIAPDNRYAYAEYGIGEKLFGIICHLDVVPPGNISEWKTDPFSPTLLDGKLYGRGVLDDKGPSIINIFAFKYLIDKGFNPDYKVRFIFGTSEETTWECMEAYVQREQLCDLGYVPDGYFPVVYAEKWIIDTDLLGNFKCDFKIKGGQIYNAVNDLVEYQGPNIDRIVNFLNDNQIETYLENKSLFVKGIAAHGSLPHFGKSASTWLLVALDYLQVKHPLVQFVSKYIHLQHNMKQVYGDLTDETGNLTVCNGIIDLDQNGFRFTLNHRVPCTKDPEKNILLKLTDFCKDKQIEVQKVKLENRVYFDKNSEVVTKIMDVYKEVTGNVNAQPIAIGGGTFAKSMPNMIAFGAIFDEATSTMHAYNEFVTIEELKQMMEIYTKSLVKLLKK